MPKITLRGNKTTALTYGELDENFTALGLAHDMDTAGSNVAVSVDTVTATTGTLTTGAITTVNATDVNVSGAIITGGFTEEGDDAKIQSIGTAFDSHLFTRTASDTQGTNDLISLMVQTDYDTEGHNLADNQSAGIFGKFDTADKTDVLGGGLKWVADNVTDTNNFNTHVQLSCYDVVSGSNSEVLYTLEPKKAVFPGALKLTPTDYADLPANSGSSDNGMIAFLNQDGGGATQDKLIYSQGGAWYYVHDNSTVASS